VALDHSLSNHVNCGVEIQHVYKGVLGETDRISRVVRSKLMFQNISMFLNILTTSIDNTQIKWKHSKTNNTSETISSFIFGSAPILQTLCAIYEIQWDKYHSDPEVAEPARVELL
jgi:hypothetical protein